MGWCIRVCPAALRHAARRCTHRRVGSSDTSTTRRSRFFLAPASPLLPPATASMSLTICGRARGPGAAAG